MKTKLGLSRMALFTMLALAAALFSPARAYAAPVTVPANASRDVIQRYLDLASENEPLTVRIPAGTYSLSDSLYISSNTTLILDKNAKIVCAFAKEQALLYGGHRDVTGGWCGGENCNHGGYTQVKNITIDGGIWDRTAKYTQYDASNIHIVHGENITIRNLTITHGTDHMLNLSACKNVTVENVTFKDADTYTGDSEVFWGRYDKGDPNRFWALEALHLDFANPKGEPGAYPHDNTPAQNVTISGCKFINVHSGIGTHHITSGNRMSNVTVTGCTFTNVAGQGINFYHADNCTASNNTFTGTPKPFYLADALNSTLSNNTINGNGGGNYYAISVFDSSTGTTISGNVFNGAASAIGVNNGSSATISRKNMVNNCTDHAIIINEGATATIEDNKFKKPAKNAIQVGGVIRDSNGNKVPSWGNATIRGNEFIDSGTSGVYVSGKSGKWATVAITGNTFNGSSGANIGIDQYVNYGTIKDNYLDDKGVWVASSNTKGSIGTNKKTGGSGDAQQTGWLKGKDSSGKTRWWYRHADGSYTKNGWEKIGGKWYLFDGGGWMCTGWQKNGGKWYYFEGSGAMVSGWKKIGNYWYLFSGGGAMLTGWQKSGNKWYYFHEGGQMATGWLKVGTKWYYFESSGAMVAGWKKIGNYWYLFNGSGAMLTGWQKSGTKWYYFQGGGQMSTGWQKINGKSYCFSPNGDMYANTTTPDGYKVDASGVWVK